MSRNFIYCRVFTATELTDLTQNQVLEVKAAGFDVQASEVVEEIISGSVSAKKRPGFQKLLHRMKSSDVLIVTKLDGLGRNAMDVRKTIEYLEEYGIRIHCLALGGVDLTSAAGKMTMQVLEAVAEFERDLLIERMQAGLGRVKKEGMKLGRPEALATTKSILTLKDQGKSQSSVAAELGLGIATVKRHWNKVMVVNGLEGSYVLGQPKA